MAKERMFGPSPDYGVTVRARDGRFYVELAWREAGRPVFESCPHQDGHAWRMTANLCAEEWRRQVARLSEQEPEARLRSDPRPQAFTE